MATNMDDKVGECFTPEDVCEPVVTCIVDDVPVSDETGAGRALSSLPDGLQIRSSRIPEAGLGVFAVQDFQEGTRFGPYVGVTVDKTAGARSDYAWEIRGGGDQGEATYCIDGQDEARSNWMRYVNCARKETEQNLRAYQDGGSIYYLAYKPIGAGTELLTFYGEDYGRKLGIKMPSETGSGDAPQQGIMEKCELPSSSQPVPRAIKSTRPAKAPQALKDNAVLADVPKLSEDSQPTEKPSLQRNMSDPSAPEPVVCTWFEDVQDWAEGLIDLDDNDENMSAAGDDDQVMSAAGDDDQDQSAVGEAFEEESTVPAGDTSCGGESGGWHICRECGQDFDDFEALELHVAEVHQLQGKEGTAAQHAPASEGTSGTEEHATVSIQKFAPLHHTAPISDGSLGGNIDEDGHLTLHGAEANHDSLLMHPEDEGADSGKPFPNIESEDSSTRVSVDEDTGLCSVMQGNTSSVDHCPPSEVDLFGNRHQSSEEVEGSHDSQEINVVGDSALQNNKADEDGISSNIGDKLEHVIPVNEGGSDMTISVRPEGSHDIEDGMSQHEWRQSICGICRKACHSKQALEEHLKTHSLLKCGTCFVSFLDEESLVQHEKDHKERPFFCGTCGKTFKSFHSLKDHKYSHTNEKPFACPYCPKGFIRNKKLKLHIRKAHQKLVKALQKPPPAPLVLPQNANLVKGRKILTSASTKTSTSDTSACSYCRMSFKDTDTRKTHEMTCEHRSLPKLSQITTSDQEDSDSMGQQRYICKVCGLNYHTKKGLERHSKIHRIWGSAPSPHGSDSAGSSIPDREGHEEQSNIGPRPFKCQLCESTFLEENHLQIHVEIHSMDGPWACVVCCKRFKQRAHLLEHMYVHWDYKPYICLYCPMDFKRTYEAEKHMNLHKHQERRKQSQKEKLSVPAGRLRRKDEVQEQPTHSAVHKHSDDSQPSSEVRMDLATARAGSSADNREEANAQDDNQFTLQPLLPTQNLFDGKNRPFTCELCDRSFTAKSSLREHLFLHYGKPYPCDFCERQFTRKAYLISHMNETHPEADTSSVKESVLDAKYEEIINKALEKFQTVDQKKVSQATPDKQQTGMSPEKQYSCKVCDKTFLFSTTLQQHMRAHIKRKPLLCDFCERRFVRRSYLDEHIRTQHPPGSRSKDPGKPFKCEICDLAFSKRAYLKDHKYRHKLKKPFPCTFCTKSFRRRCLLQIHISRHHSTDYRKMASARSKPSVSESPKSAQNTLKIKLPFQKKLSDSSSSLKKDPLMCPECGTTFSCRANVLRHMLIHSGERPFQCKVCHWTFNRKEILLHHMKKKHPSSSYQLDSKDDSGFDHKQSASHKCPKCNGVFKTSLALHSHMKQHKSTNSNPFVCSYCDFSFLRHADLAKHTRNVHGLSVTTEASTAPASNTKIVKVESGNGTSTPPKSVKGQEELHVCHRCGARFDSFWGLESHSRVHEKHSRFPRPYKCVKCGAAFKGLSNHTRHMRVHTAEYAAETKRLLNLMPGRKSVVQGGTQEKPHVCPKCGTGYKFARNLRKHISRHVKSSDRPYQCTVCGIYGRNKLSIAKHQAIHGKTSTSLQKGGPQNVHLCKQCGAGFSSKQRLLQHMHSHTNSKPTKPKYKCKHCNREFIQRGSLIIHERSHNSLNFTFSKNAGHRAEANTENNAKRVFVIKGLECPVCKKTFTRRSGVSNHMKVHQDVEYVWEGDLMAPVENTDEKPFQCRVCFVRFRKKSSLSNHMQVHGLRGASLGSTGSLPPEKGLLASGKSRQFSCNQCSCAFRTRASLITHKRVHSHGDDAVKRNYLCNICHCRFINSTNLKKHKRIHIGYDDSACAQENRQAFENADNIDVKTKRPFRCRVCDETFKAKHLLDEHIQIHSTSPRQSHPSAKQKVSSPGVRTSIVTAGVTSGETFARMLERPYPCSICGDRFKLKSTKYKHMRLHKQSEGKPFRCSHCGLGFYSVGNMTKHLKRVHERVRKDVQTPHKAPPELASPLLSSPNALKKRPFACKYCGDTFTMRCNMNRHRKRHETGDNLPFRCSHCGFGFKSTKERTKHIMRAHSEVQKTSPTPSVLPVVIGGKKRYKCPLCGDSFSEPSGLYKHMRVHAKSANKPFRCKVCGIGYNTLIGLSRHQGRVNHKEDSTSAQLQQTEADVKPDIHRLQVGAQQHNRHKCKYCPAVYKDRSSLWRHEKVHKLGPSNHRRFSCRVCGFACYAKFHLQRHMQMHSKHQGALHSDVQAKKRGSDRCKRCGLLFRTRSHLLVHMKRCSSTSTFVCKICSVPFSNQIMLTKHVRQDHNALQRDVIYIGGREIIRETGHDKKFCCDQCDARYKRPSELEKHLRRHAMGFIKSQNHSSALYHREQKVDVTSGDTQKNDLSQKREDSDDFDQQQQKRITPSPQPTLEAIRQSLSPGRTPVHNRTAKSNKARPYVCQTCGFAFMTDIHLRKHTRLHKLAHTKPFVCKVCTLGYTRLLDYHRHCNVVHPWKKSSPNEISCPRCKEQFENKAKLVEHLEKQICQFKDDPPDEMHNESSIHSNMSSVGLSETSEQSVTDLELSKGDIKCPICACHFQAKAHVEMHMKVHDNWEHQPFRCEKCRLGYSTKQHLSKHLNSNALCLRLAREQQKDEGTTSTSTSTATEASSNQMPRYEKPPVCGAPKRQCPHCGKMFAKRSQLEVHIALHTPSADRPHICEKCGIGYKTLSNYVKHMKWENSKPSTEQTKLTAAIFMCRDCGYSVTNKALLHEHNQDGCPKKKANPDTQAPKACPVCGNYFRSPSMFCIHLHGHVYDQLFKCSQCPLRFSVPEERDVHERDHPDWNDMLLKLLSSEFNRKLNSGGERSADEVSVKQEPGIEEPACQDSDRLTGREQEPAMGAPIIKPEPVDEPEYNYSMGLLENSTLGDYQALLPDAPESNMLSTSQGHKGTKKSSTSQDSPVSRLEKIVSNLAAQRPPTDNQERPDSCPQTNQNQPIQSAQQPSEDVFPEPLPRAPQKESQQVTSVQDPNPKSADSANQNSKPKAKQQKLFRCRYCPSAFRLKGLCQAHERTVHRKIYSRGSQNKSKPLKDLSKMFICDICNSVFEQQSSLSRHMLFKHGMPWKAKEPEEVQKKSVSVESSDENTSGLFITNVTSQGRIASSRSRSPSLLRERLQSPPDDSYGVKIDQSAGRDLAHSSSPSQNQSTLENLLTGSAVSENDSVWTPGYANFRPYKCERCNFAFTQRHHLVRHIKRDSCAFHVLGRKAAAQLKSGGSAGLEGGLKIKAPEKKHKCPVCPRAFWKQSRLENHMQKMHGDPSVFVCCYCTKEFRQKSECAIHEASCPAAGPTPLGNGTMEEMAIDYEGVEMGSDEELDRAQEEAFMDDQDQDLGYEDMENEPLPSYEQDEEQEWTSSIQIKEEPLD